MREIVILQSAEADWYVHYSRFGEKFDDAFLSTICLLKSNPEMGTRTPFGSVRRVLIRNTIFGIFYEQSGKRIIVSAILDLRQDPALIERRLRDFES